MVSYAGGGGRDILSCVVSSGHSGIQTTGIEAAAAATTTTTRLKKK